MLEDRGVQYLGRRILKVASEEKPVNKIHFVVVGCVLALLASPRGANATEYVCPAPSAVNCVPAQNQMGPWKANGGMMTGNTFAPNNICSNMDKLPNGQTRLLCCYVKCGVFYQDVKARQCTKLSESTFSCD